MVANLQTSTKPDIIYPESDGLPMADNTEQFDWIVIIKLGLESLFADNTNVFIAGDLLWYPVEGDNKTRVAPDVMVAFGRPKGKRGSYQQWREDNITPQVVFEILSLGNTLKEMANKFQFYNRYGVEEYYLYDPDKVDLTAWLRSETGLEVIEQIKGWVSPRLGIRFELAEDELQIYRPDGQRFATYVEVVQQIEQERQRAEQAESMLEQERQRSQALEARLQELGIDPEVMPHD